jgi:repressor LexA
MFKERVVSMTIGQKIKERRKSLGMSAEELGYLIGKNPATIYRYEKGDIEKLPSTILGPLAKALNCSAGELIAGADTEVPTPTQDKSVRIPVLGYVVAGVPISAVQDILGYEEISKDLSLTGEFFALRIKGSSMEPQFFEGDIVIVRQQSDVDDNDIAIVLVNGDEATVKQIKKSDAGLTLIGFNVTVYPPRFYSNKDIEELPVSIIGKVVQVRRDY